MLLICCILSSQFDRLGESKKEYSMGDKGKKDKAKSQKQKVKRQEQKEKKKQDKKPEKTS